MNDAERQRLKDEYSGRAVAVDEQRPELARFAGKRGHVIDINFNGRALVQFDGPNIGWFDIAPEFLAIVEATDAEHKDE
jgi:hypothetical protein